MLVTEIARGKPGCVLTQKNVLLLLLLLLLQNIIINQFTAVIYPCVKCVYGPQAVHGFQIISRRHLVTVLVAVYNLKYWIRFPDGHRPRDKGYAFGSVIGQ